MFLQFEVNSWLIVARNPVFENSSALTSESGLIKPANLLETLGGIDRFAQFEEVPASLLILEGLQECRDD